MDTIEASKMVMSRIQNIDPQNASKIMGYILIQDQTENEMIRLAFAPENLLASLIKQAKAFLHISSNTSSAPSSPSPFGHTNHPPLSPSGSFQDSMLFSHLNSARSACGGDVIRGYGKNGMSCKFVCGNGDGCFGGEMCVGCSSPTAIVEAPTGVDIDGVEDFMRIKAIQQQQRVVAMAARGPHSFSFKRCITSHNETLRSPLEAASRMMGEDFHKFGPFRPDRHDLAAMGLGNSSSSSRQIYLTFPADSSFKEEDVSNYFSIFGPVQDVRIPYQQKRMFGFVSFVLAETVKSILAKGNPHFVCDSRVLVKPYKEKGKIPIKKHRHQIVRGDFSALEYAEPFDHIPFGARMFNHDMMLRRNLKGRDEYQQTIDFQERKLMNMQLTTDHQLQHSLSNSQTSKSLVHVGSLNVYGEEINCSDTQEPLTEGSDSKVPREVNDDDRDLISGKEENSDLDGTYNHESFEHILPDNLFASPTKAAGARASGGINQTSLNMASLESC